MLTDTSSKKVSTSSYRRPFGCAGKWCTMFNCFTEKPPWGSEIKYMYVCMYPLLTENEDPSAG